MSDPAAARDPRDDRIVGTMLGLAAGDALGAPWEFGPPLASSVELSMTGGGGFNWEPGEWTDDTSMAIAILETLSAGADLDDETTLDTIVQRWSTWADDAPDVGAQTWAVLRRAAALTEQGPPTAAGARLAARQVHETQGKSGGNGSLMRTAPIALSHLADSAADPADAATRISDLTHFDPDAGQACALWTTAIRAAILTGRLDIRTGLAGLGEPAASRWSQLIEAAEHAMPADFTHNGWVVEAFQGAWSAVSYGLRVSPEAPLVPGVEAAVRGGRDTDTVAAIAGSLLGAACGASAIPDAWLAPLHGWPELTGEQLGRLALAAAWRS